LYTKVDLVPKKGPTTKRSWFVVCLSVRQSNREHFFPLGMIRTRSTKPLAAAAAAAPADPMLPCAAEKTRCDREAVKQGEEGNSA